MVIRAHPSSAIAAAHPASWRRVTRPSRALPLRAAAETLSVREVSFIREQGLLGDQGRTRRGLPLDTPQRSDDAVSRGLAVADAGRDADASVRSAA